MSSEWDSTMLLRVADHAYVRAEPRGDGREAQELVQCPQCRRTSDWLIAAADGRVEFACRCGHDWRLPTGLPDIVALAEHQPKDQRWRSFDDVRQALGFTPRTRGMGVKALRSHRHRRETSATVTVSCVTQYSDG